jgi:multisubunit Na+/H+ antiporter MnhG subunit
MTDSLSNIKKDFFKQPINAKQAGDTGMAMVLICLIIGLFTHNGLFFKIATLLLVVNMIWPTGFRPVARIWIGGSVLLGTVVSKILLSIIFFGLVTPIGVVRRIAGADAMLLKQWKKGSSSVFKERNYQFQAKDVEKPF